MMFELHICLQLFTVWRHYDSHVEEAFARAYVAYSASLITIIFRLCGLYFATGNLIECTG